MQRACLPGQPRGWPVRWKASRPRWFTSPRGHQAAPVLDLTAVGNGIVDTPQVRLARPPARREEVARCRISAVGWQRYLQYAINHIIAKVSWHYKIMFAVDLYSHASGEPNQVTTWRFQGYGGLRSQVRQSGSSRLYPGGDCC